MVNLVVESVDMRRRSMETITGLMLILSAVYGGQSIAAADTLKSCEQELAHLQTSTADVAKLIQGWIELGNSCQGTGSYEYRLSKLYINMPVSTIWDLRCLLRGRHKQAVEILDVDAGLVVE